MGTTCAKPEIDGAIESDTGVAPYRSPYLDNIMLLSDSYKTSHWRQYPPNTTEVYSYFESRGGKFDEVVFFGLQYFMKRYLQGKVVTRERINAAERIVNGHMGLGEMKHFNREGWEYILEKHDGRLPVVIKAAPEGMVVPVKNVLMTVANTDPKCFWLTNYLETLLVQVWYPMTVATQSRAQKQVIMESLIKTGTDLKNMPNKLPVPLKMITVGYQLNDFGCRGVSSMETASIGGAAHLVNFCGSDTMPGLCTAIDYYNLPLEQCVGTSVPAAEHSTITSWTKAGEKSAFENMLKQYPEGIVAVVSDSYDIFNACEKLWGTELKDLIASRAAPGRLVVRPDSGDPKTIVVEVLERLGKHFPVTTNSAGFKVLPSYIRVIQGDGISYESLKEILGNLEAKKWAAENVCFGSGGALLQKMDRDTQKCAFKCCEAIVDGKPRPVFKDPVTDQGKKSKQGRLKLVKREGKLTTLTDGQGDEKEDLLVEVFRNGEITKTFTFQDVRQQSEVGLVTPIFDDLGPMPTSECREGLLHGLRDLLTSKELCDIALVAAGGEAFPAHRTVLAACSPALRERLSKLHAASPQADGLPVIALDVKHCEAVKALIDSVYGSSAAESDRPYNPSSEAANLDVLKLAREFELPALEDQALLVSKSCRMQKPSNKLTCKPWFYMTAWHNLAHLAVACSMGVSMAHAESGLQAWLGSHSWRGSLDSGLALRTKQSGSLSASQFL
ncbi:Nampt [Symbiodinium pilosum]|uniref:Nicotinamide phosphoribosyltransferase n=1 Tax=Symbiodinium pilosum TaxID=2952 RepID=A0A812RPH1_SYMPI|nr:Nampt [Symbiodinium pilosum]